MPANPPYIPAQDGLFDAWLSNFSSLLTAAPTTYGLLAGDAVIVAGLFADWNAAYILAVTPSTRTPVTVADKDDLKVSALQGVRPYAVRIASNPGVANMDKVSIGVTVRVTTRTPVPPPAVSPGLSLVAMTPGQGQFRYFNLADPFTKSVPYGSAGVEVWSAIGTTFATDPAQATYRGRVTKAPFVQSFDGADAGKKLTMWVRYVNRGGAHGQPLVGPWSDVLQSTIV